MTTVPDHFVSVFFLLGLLVVAVHAWQRFNEPSFPNRDTLPRAVAPLRYLFLKRAYRRALVTYMAISLVLYSVLVLPGPSIIPALGLVGVQNFPAEGWALLVALFLVGLVPNSHLRWLTALEEGLRRLVHSCFLVPDGIVRTIGLLEDARYEPPAAQLDALSAPVRKRVRNDLKHPVSSLRHRWARATMLIESLRQMGAGASHPLSKAAFGPFEKDFEEIVEKHRELATTIAARTDSHDVDETSDSAKRSVDALLSRIYAYISCGVRHQATTEHEVDSTLVELGFSVPPGPKDGGSLFDIMAPTVLLIAAITGAFWLTFDSVGWANGNLYPSVHESVLFALISMVAASIMYGCAVFISLKWRSVQIERKMWRQSSPKCLVPIAARAGVLTWIVIVASTAIGRHEETVNSLRAIGQGVASLALSGGGEVVPEEWAFLPVRIATALPWVLAGATVSVLLASLLGGDLRRAGTLQRARDALWLSVGLGLAAAAAQLVQTSLSAVFAIDGATPLQFVPVIGLAGAACGAVVGWTVPSAFRATLVAPYDPIMARALRNLVDEAETVLGSRAAAEDWVFTPRNELGGITPAEAVEYKTQATGVKRLLDSEKPRLSEEAKPADGPMPVVIDGGRNRDKDAA